MLYLYIYDSPVALQPLLYTTVRCLGTFHTYSTPSLYPVLPLKFACVNVSKLIKILSVLDLRKANKMTMKYAVSRGHESLRKRKKKKKEKAMEYGRKSRVYDLLLTVNCKGKGRSRKVKERLRSPDSNGVREKKNNSSCHTKLPGFL